MTGPEGVMVPSDGDGPPAPPRRARRIPAGPVRGRWQAALAVVAVLAAVSAISSAFPAPVAAPAPGSADGVPVPPPGSSSSSAFCTAGTGNAANATIFLTNSTPHAVSGVVTSVAASAGGGPGPTVHRTVTVPGLGSAAVDPSAGLPQGSSGSSFAFAGGGVVAAQVVGGPNGWSTAPCASQISPQWFFAGGSTAQGATTALSLFDPAAAEAVVNVSFLTNDGVITPQAYQGLVVLPGQMVVENVGDFVQNASDIATVVTTQSGAVVASEFQQVSRAGGGGLALRLGSPALSTVWRFGQTTLRPGTTVDFSVANPGAATVVATLTVGLSAGTVVPRRMVIPPQTIVDVAASGIGGLPQQIPFSVTFTATGPIAVGRAVLAAVGSPTPVWGASSGTVTTANRWLVPGPGIPHVPGTAGARATTLAVADPGPSAARVALATLDGHQVAAFTVAPAQVTVLGPRQVGGLTPLSVVSSQPVNVEEDAAPSGAPGVVSSTGFPFANPG